eukprot:GAHX01001516.1.p1 GENE.GAHX01001516.1~~GAHX01001516.1.p1  ORF type:complete len:354 (-),score=59.23 GAHX01001516.1:267-1328(-)
MNKDSATVWISNIPFDCTESQINAYLSKVGTIKFFRFVIDKKSGNHKGQGFCTYTHTQFAESAVRNLNKKEYRGRILNIVLNTNKEDSSVKNWQLDSRSMGWQVLPIDQEINSFSNNITTHFKIGLIKEFIYFARKDPKLLSEFLKQNPIMTQLLVCILQRFKVINGNNKKMMLISDLELTKGNKSRFLVVSNVPSYIPENQFDEQIKTLTSDRNVYSRYIYNPETYEPTGEALIEFKNNTAAFSFYFKHNHICFDNIILEVRLAADLVEKKDLRSQFSSIQNNQHSNMVLDDIYMLRRYVMELEKSLDLNHGIRNVEEIDVIKSIIGVNLREEIKTDRNEDDSKNEEAKIGN